MSEIRSDYCIALRIIALQEYHREAQGWLSEYLEGDDMMRAVAVSDYNALLDRCIAIRAENEKLQWELRKALDTLAVHDAVCAENDKLRSALKPFALSEHKIERWFGMDIPDSYSVVSQWVTVGDLRAAATALKETGDE